MEFFLLFVFMLTGFILSSSLLTAEDFEELFVCLKKEIESSKPVFYFFDEEKEGNNLVLRLYETGVLQILSDDKFSSVIKGDLKPFRNRVKTCLSNDLELDNTNIINSFLEVIDRSNLESVGTIVLDLRLYEEYLYKRNKEMKDIECIDIIESIRSGVCDGMTKRNSKMTISAIHTFLDRGLKEQSFCIKDDTKKVTAWYNIDITPGSVIYDKFLHEEVDRGFLLSLYKDDTIYKRVVRSVIFQTRKEYYSSSRLYPKILYMFLKDKAIHHFVDREYSLPKNKQSIVITNQKDRRVSEKYREIFSSSLKNNVDMAEISVEVLRKVFHREELKRNVSELIQSRRFKEIIEDHLEVFSDIRRNVLRQAIIIYNGILFKSDSSVKSTTEYGNAELTTLITRQFFGDKNCVDRSRSDLLKVLNSDHLVYSNGINRWNYEYFKSLIKKRLE